jgi:hypothetical protein
MILMILQSDDEKESIERSKMFKNYQKKNYKHLLYNNLT